MDIKFWKSLGRGKDLEGQQDESKKSRDAILHELWTRDVGTPGYDKEKWKELSRILWEGINAVDELEKQKRPHRVELDEGLNRLRKGGVNAPPPVDAVPPPDPPPQRRTLTEGKTGQGNLRKPPREERPKVRPQAEIGPLEEWHDKFIGLIVDWNKLEKDIVVRIRTMRDAFSDKLIEPSELRQQLWNDLALPNLGLLMKFCENVKVEDDEKE